MPLQIPKISTNLLGLRLSFHLSSAHSHSQPHISPSNYRGVFPTYHGGLTYARQVRTNISPSITAEPSCSQNPLSLSLGCSNNSASFCHSVSSHSLRKRPYPWLCHALSRFYGMRRESSAINITRSLSRSRPLYRPPMSCREDKISPTV